MTYPNWPCIKPGYPALRANGNAASRKEKALIFNCTLQVH